MLAALALALAGVIVVEAAREILNGLEAEAPAAPAPPQVVEVARDEGPPSLVDRDVYALKPDAPTSFMIMPITDGEAFCRSLQNAGLSKPSYARGPWPSGTWTCVPEILVPAAGDESAASSLFVSIRGEEPNLISTMRIKLNLLDPETAPQIRAVAKDLLMRMMDAFGAAPPQAILDAIDAGRDQSIKERGVSYDLKKEFGDPRRSNLVVGFRQRLGQGGDDSFVDPRRN